MRILLLLILALPIFANAAAVTVSRCWTPDGPYVETTYIATRCPAQIAAVGQATNITSDAYDVAVTTNTATTTMYFYTIKNTSSCAALAPSRKTMISGAGAVHFATTTLAGTGTQTKSITGLPDPESAYCTYVLQMTGYRASNRITIPATTAAISTPTYLAVAGTGYFVASGGCTYNVSTCDGLSHAKALSGLDQVPSTPVSSTQNDIWILAGSTLSYTTGKLDTDWGGTANDPAYIGCYYLDSGTPRACWEGAGGAVLNNEGSTVGSVTTMGNQALPVLDGTLTAAKLVTKTNNFTWPTGDCNNFSDAAVKINHSYVTVRGIHVRRSACRGMTINPTTPSQYVKVQDSIFSQLGGQMIVIGQKTQKYTIIKNNIFREGGKCDYEAAANECGAQTDPNARGHAGGVVFTNPGAYGGMVDNTFVRSYTEGLQCFGATHVWVKGNRVGNTQFGNYYFDACKSGVSESNIVWGTNGDVGQSAGDNTVSDSNRGKMPTFVEKSNVTCTGIPSSGTCTPDTGKSLENMILRNNLFASPQAAISTGAHKWVQYTNIRINAKWYHNTVIGPRESALSTNEGVLTSAMVTGIDVRNNLFAPPAPSTAGACYVDGADTTYDYNLYGYAGTAGNCTNSNDIGGADTIVNPNLVLNPYNNSAIQATWAAHSHSDMPDPDNAKVTVDTNGADLNGGSLCIPQADLDEYKNIAGEMDSPYSLDRDVVPDGVQDDEMTLWGYCAYYDFFGNARSDTPTVGFHEFGGAL